LVYPQEIGPVSITPPFIKFTLGNMFKNKEAFIESLTYTIDDNTPWEVGLNGSSVKDFKLPTIINVDISLTLVETIGSTYEQRLYGYGNAISSEENKSDTLKNLNPDGSPKIKKDVPANKTIKEGGKEQKPKNPSQEKPKVEQKPKAETKPFTNGSGPLALPKTSAINALSDISKYTFKGNKF
jgi:hypothetical protein